MKHTILATAAVVGALTSPALAGERAVPAPAKTMSTDFIGDWCFGDGYDAQTKETNYRLPSWATDGQCDKTKILSVDKYGFLFNYWDLQCDVVSARYTSDTAPSGTGYTAKVTASCSRSGEWKPVFKTFEFHRYKGNLYVKG
jgi:hypothetical protein